MNKTSINHQVTKPISPTGSKHRAGNNGIKWSDYKAVNFKQKGLVKLRGTMKKLRQIMFGIFIVGGLALAGSNAPTLELQVVGNVLGLILFVIGGCCFVWECKKT